VLPGLVDPHPAGADYRGIPARADGGRREESALALGQLRDAQAITDPKRCRGAKGTGVNIASRTPERLQKWVVFALDREDRGAE